MEGILSSWLVWLIIAAVLVIVELLTNTFAAFCLVGGCLIAMTAALFGLGMEAQLAGAAAGTVIAFIAFAPLIKKHREAARHNHEPSNMDALIGRTATTAEAIPGNGIGRARIDGDNWQVRTADGSGIEKGVQIRVTGYDSIILTVERASAKQ